MVHQILEPDPAATSVPTGAAAIGNLAELDKRLQIFVLYMRRWTAHISERAGVWHDATERFGEAKSHRVIGALDIFLQTVANHAARPIQRHGKCCHCLGEDEATLAEIVAGAGRQDGPLLRLLARPLVTPTGFTEVVSAAVQLHEMLCEPSLKLASVSETTFH